MIGKRVVYSGRVQGVGFRRTVERLADGRPVAGYVRNLPGGSVELVVEGDEAEVSAFLAAVAEEFTGYIRGSRAEVVPVEGMTGFGIRY